MLNLKKIVLLSTMVVTIIATTATAFAATPFTNPNGISVSDLDEWKKQMLETKIEILDKRVEAGLITQEQADQIIERIEANQAVCDGTRGGRTGQGMGLGMGFGFGQGRGNGQGACGNWAQNQ